MSKWNSRGDGPGGSDRLDQGRPLGRLPRAVARRTGRPEVEILSFIGAVFLAVAVIDFLREVDAVMAAGRTGRHPAGDAAVRGLEDGDGGGKGRIRMREGALWRRHAGGGLMKREGPRGR